MECGFLLQNNTESHRFPDLVPRPHLMLELTQYSLPKKAQTIESSGRLRAELSETNKLTWFYTYRPPCVVNRVSITTLVCKLILFLFVCSKVHPLNFFLLTIFLGSSTEKINGFINPCVELDR